MSNFLKHAKAADRRTKHLPRIGYQYQHKQLDPNANKTNAATIDCLIWEKNHATTFHSVYSDTLIMSFDYFVHISRLWDQKSREINGWTSAHLTISTAQTMLSGLKSKYRYNPKDIKFANVTSMYSISGIVDKNISALNAALFAIWIAAAENPATTDFINLRTIIEGISKSQLMYHIANYKCRRNRPYKLPWEVHDDPVIEFRKKYTKIAMDKMQKSKVDKEIKFRQPGIRQFFKPMSRKKTDNSDCMDEKSPPPSPQSNKAAICSKISSAASNAEQSAIPATNDDTVQTDNLRDSSVPTDAEAAAILEELLQANQEEDTEDVYGWMVSLSPDKSEQNGNK